MLTDNSQPASSLLIAYWSSEGNGINDKNPRIQELQRALNKEIESWLHEEKKAFDKRRNGIKILLLGQSESGKSSVLKNFQLAFVPKQFDNERSAWKIIVHLNIIGSLKTIIDTLEHEWESESMVPDEEDARSAFQTFQALRVSLTPLFRVESNLLQLLTPDGDDCRSMFIRAGNDWKATLYTKTKSAAGSQVISEEYDPAPVLMAQRDNIVSLWRNPKVQQLLAERQLSLRHSSGFFMDDIERVMEPKFLPTDSDIIRARLRTVGIEEQHFEIPKRSREGAATSNDFYIIDVAGARSQRHTWVPFFDDVQCILFLAPLAFNETLEEDHKTNKIEDSFQLWKAICKNKLLANIHIILFLNKKDVLEATLEDGVQVKTFVPTYRDRPNDVQSVTKYFRDRFQHFHKKYSPDTRTFKCYETSAVVRNSPDTRAFRCYETSAVDIQSMKILLFGVRDLMLRDWLSNSNML